MTLAYILKLGPQTCHIDVKAQKIDGSIFETFRMIFLSFQVEDKLKKARFFHETFLLTDISVKVVVNILLITFSNTNIRFVEKKLT